MSANSENITRAIALIERQRGGGGTELAAALRTAIKLPRSNFESRSIVVITDGYIAEESDSVTLINANLEHEFLRIRYREQCESIPDRRHSARRTG
jgi:Ca-activated chloride channel family protein